MSENQVDKSAMKKLRDWVLNQSWFQIKNQIAEEMKAQGAENLKVENLNLNININFGDTNYSVPSEFPSNTDIQRILEILNKIAPESPPKLGELKLDRLEDKEWVTDLLNSTASASTATLTAIATFSSTDSLGQNDDCDTDLDPDSNSRLDESNNEDND